MQYTVIAPDRDVEDSRLNAPKVAEIKEWPAERTGLSAGVRKRQCHLFKHSEAGEMEKAELEDFAFSFRRQAL